MLCILKEEMRRNGKGLWDMFMYVYCNEWKKYSWVPSHKIKSHSIKDGMYFRQIGIYEFEKFEDFYSQFRWKARNSELSPYLKGNYKGKRHEAHKIVVWNIVGERISHPLCIDHKDGDVFNNHPSNLEVVFLFENQERSKAFKGGVHPTLNRKRWRAYFQNKYISTHDTREEALQARQKAISNYLDLHKPQCLKKIEYNLLIDDYVRKQKEYEKDN